MIEDLLADPRYWLIVVLTIMLLRCFVRFSFFDFKFLIFLFFAQYLAHSTLIFGLSTFSVFCALYIVAFVGGYFCYSLLPNVTLNDAEDGSKVETWLVRTCKLMLIGYFGWRLTSIPILSGPLDLALRLQMQQESRVAFFLGVVMLPPFAACTFYWVRNRRFGWSDMLALALTAIGTLTTGSKASVLPLVLIYIGIRAYVGRPLKPNLWVIAGVAVVGAMLVVALQSLFPSLGIEEIAKLVLFRVVANTDNLEYLYVTGLRPDEYPFAGVPAMLPFVFKPLGAQIDFPYGVWLHGMRYGDWSGFGPNSGFILEQFGNLRWAGVLMGVVLGGLVRWTTRVPSAFRAMVLSFAYVLLVESTTFFLNLLFSTVLLSVALLVVRITGGLYARMAKHKSIGRLLLSPAAETDLNAASSHRP